MNPMDILPLLNPMQAAYPTKEQILAEMEAHPPRAHAIAELKAWRKLHPKGQVTLEALADLVGFMERTYEREAGTVTVKPGLAYCYVPDLDTIMLDASHPSVISTLHETAHMLFGPSELTACAWSIALFKAAYPKAYARLEWHGHMLVKPTNSPNANR